MEPSSVPLSGKATVDAMADNWAKLLAIYMHAQCLDEIVINAQQIESIGRDGEMEKCLVVQELKDGLHIRLMPVAQAQALARANRHGFSKQ